MLKHPISADVGLNMPLLPDIYGFERPPTLPPENATFTNGTLYDFSKMLKKWQNYYVTDCLKNIKWGFPGNCGDQKFLYTFFRLNKKHFLTF